MYQLQLLPLRFDISSMNVIEFTTKKFCGNAVIGHPQTLKFVIIVDMNNNIDELKKEVDKPCSGGKYTAIVSTRKT